MLRAASAFSRASDTEIAAREVGEALAGALPAGGSRVALFFASPDHQSRMVELERTLRAVASLDHAVGCSAAGLIDGAGEVEGLGVGAFALGGGSIEADTFFLPALRGRSFELGREIGRICGEEAQDPLTVLAFADSYNLAPDELLAGLDLQVGGAPVVGAGASDDGRRQSTVVAGREAAGDDAVAGLVLRGVKTTSSVVSTSRPVGEWSKVTRSECHRVLQLAGRPAFDVYLESLPRVLREDLPRALATTRIALGRPEGEFVVRGLIGVDEEHRALLVGDEIMPGSSMALAVHDPVSSRAAFEHGVDTLLPAGNRSVGVLYFKDAAAGDASYGVPGFDQAYLQTRLGAAPCAGFRCGMMFAPLEGRNRFHQFGGTMISFEEPTGVDPECA